MFQNRSAHLRSRSGTVAVVANTQLKCPRCQGILQPVAAPNARPSLCRGCDGLFVPGLDRFAHLGMEAMDLVGRSERVYDRAGSACPSGCDGAMERRRMGNAAFEWCALCEGLWFDRGMVAVLKSAAERAVAARA